MVGVKVPAMSKGNQVGHKRGQTQRVAGKAMYVVEVSLSEWPVGGKNEHVLPTRGCKQRTCVEVGGKRRPIRGVEYPADIDLAKSTMALVPGRKCRAADIGIELRE